MSELKERILLVDDEKHLLVSLRDFLKFEGFDVQVAQSGEDALKVLETERPDLIILDISMPGMGGLGFLRRISGADGHPSFPVLVLTARSKMEEFFNTLDVDGFLAKPCDENSLVRKIREILALRKGAPARSGRDRLKVLLAEDDAAVVRSIETALSASGYDVVTVPNGPEVLEKASTEHPDVIVMKEILPRLNGSAVASFIQVMPSMALIHVIIYDETLMDTANLPAKFSSLRNIRKVLRTSDAATILATLDGLLKV